MWPVNKVPNNMVLKCGIIFTCFRQDLCNPDNFRFFSRLDFSRFLSVLLLYSIDKMVEIEML